MSYSGTLATTELIGNLGNDPEIKETNNGKKYAVLSIATKIKTGANDEETLWHRVVVWNESTIDKYIIPYIKKGAKLYIKGDLKYYKMDTDDGKTIKMYSVELSFGGEIMILDKKSDGNTDTSASAPAIESKKHNSDIPF